LIAGLIEILYMVNMEASQSAQVGRTSVWNVRCCGESRKRRVSLGTLLCFESKLNLKSKAIHHHADATKVLLN